MPAGPLFATVAREKNTLRLQSVNEEAARLGLHPGMPLAEARAMFPSLETAEADPAADAAFLADLAAWCQRWTPLVALDGGDGVMLDMTGCLHLFGGAEACLDIVVKSLEKQGVFSRPGLAATPGAARALSRYGSVTICPAGHELRLIGPLPVGALLCPDAVVQGLLQAGLRRIDDLFARPRAPLAARFGSGLLSRLDEALGLDFSPISPVFPAPCYLAETRFPDPVARVETIEAAILRLAGRLGRMLEDHGEGMRQAELCLFRTDGAVRRLAVGASRPLREQASIVRLFRERIIALGDALDPGFGFDLVRLSVLRVDKLGAVQKSFEEKGDADGCVAALVDRLAARLGVRRVCKVLPAERRLPEESARFAPLPAGDGPLPHWPSPRPAAEPPNRPVRLLARPEPVEAMAAVPDGPPLRFRWRRRLIAAARAEGPERIAPEWWREPKGVLPLTRDYFRIEDQSGHRFWLFRDGLFGAETVQPRWFLHGLFA